MSPEDRTALTGPLPAGHILSGYELRGVIGIGGFGIVYDAWDPRVQREVAIKEYMPTTLATRSATHHVTLLSRSHQETFEAGLKSFINEARLLGQLDHEALVKVYQFWEENGTAYMAMPRYRGQTLKQVRAQMSHAPDEAWMRRVLDAVMGALKVLHGQEIYHRDIAPDNILLREDGRPVVLDLGAARRVITDRTQTITAMLKPHYAPVEQYAESAGLRQGAWTDIYALGATWRFLITGKPPTPATARVMGDDDLPLAQQQYPNISRAFLEVIDAMLAPRPQQRPQSISDVQRMLSGQAPPSASGPTWAPAAAAAAASDATVLHVPPGRTVPPSAARGSLPPMAPGGWPGSPAGVTPEYPADPRSGFDPNKTIVGPGLGYGAGYPDDATRIHTNTPYPQGPAHGAPHGQASAQAPHSAAPAIPADHRTQAWKEPGARKKQPAWLWAALGTAVVVGLAGAFWAMRPAPAPVQAMAGSFPSSATPGQGAAAPAGSSDTPGTSGTNTSPTPTSLPAVTPSAGGGPAAPALPSPAHPATATSAKPTKDIAGSAGTRPPGASANPDEQKPTPPRPSGTAADAKATGQTTSSGTAPLPTATPGSKPGTTAKTPAAAAAAAGPLDPMEHCGRRYFIARDRCLRGYCAMPEYARHPECERVRGICENPDNAQIEECIKVVEAGRR